MNGREYIWEGNGKDPKDNKDYVAMVNITEERCVRYEMKTNRVTNLEVREVRLRPHDIRKRYSFWGALGMKINSGS